MFTVRPYQFESNFEILFTMQYGWGGISKQALAGYVQAQLIHPAVYQRIVGEPYVAPVQTSSN